MKFHLIKLCFLCVLLVSCNTSKEIVYFQDIVVNQPEAIIGARDITVQHFQGDSLFSRHQCKSAGGYQWRTRHYRAAQRPDFHYGVQ